MTYFQINAKLPMPLVEPPPPTPLLSLNLCVSVCLSHSVCLSVSLSSLNASCIKKRKKKLFVHASWMMHCVFVVVVDILFLAHQTSSLVWTIVVRYLNLNGYNPCKIRV